MTHYIEKYRLSQAETAGFSLYDKELAHKAHVNNLSLINNELHKQANVVCEIGALTSNKARKIHIQGGTTEKNWTNRHTEVKQ
jgi:hypothetical protein